VRAFTCGLVVRGFDVDEGLPLDFGKPVGTPQLELQPHSGGASYIGERRGVLFIERSLKQGLEFARHRNNTEGLRAQVRRTITAFLLAQMNNGAFRSREPAKAFFVDVSEQLNTPTVVFAGKLIVRVGLATNKPAEFVILRISQDTRALEAELAAAGA
jgi:hypothetical protein